MTLDIIFRSCDRSTLQRYIDVPKGDLTLGCLSSVLASVALAAREHPACTTAVHILDDHSMPGTVVRMQDLLHAQGVQGVVVPMPQSGQGASMRFANEYAREHCGELVYFVEDDYLHAPSAVAELLEARELFMRKLGGRDVILSPADHEVEYRPNLIVPTRVVLGTRRHWRLARGTTSTYMISQAMLRRYWDVYMRHAQYGTEDVTEDTTINTIYTREFCFSPIPSLAAHISQPDLKPPFFNYQELWERYKPATSAATSAGAGKYTDQSSTAKSTLMAADVGVKGISSASNFL